jgi:hypothetical protein
MTRGLTILQVDEALYSSGDMAAIGNALEGEDSEHRMLRGVSFLFLEKRWLVFWFSLM